MSRYLDEKTKEPKLGAVIRDVGLVLIFLIASGMYGCPQYSVWRAGLHGQAELRRAEQNRQIAVQEAEAKRAAASLLADAEIARAKGVAEANKIIGDGLKGHEEYLKYLWIQALEHVASSSNGSTVVYVPTEANVPITEAGRLSKRGQ